MQVQTEKVPVMEDEQEVQVRLTDQGRPELVFTTLAGGERVVVPPMRQSAHMGAAQ